MMQKAFKNVQALKNVRMFSIYNYSHQQHPKVWLDVAKDGETQGKMVFELYASHSPVLAENFAAFCNGGASGARSYAGSNITVGQAGRGFQGGLDESEDVGA